jgi:hypothetical protein
MKNRFKLFMAAAVIVAIVISIFLRLTSGYWFWQNYDFKYSNWGMSPQQVFNEEDLTGRPSGSQQVPKVIRLDDGISYFVAESRHFRAITRPFPEPTRFYIFQQDKLIAGMEVVGGKDIANKIKKKIESCTAEYGEPLKSFGGKGGALTIYSANKRSYCAVMALVNKNVSFSFDVAGERHTIETGNYTTMNIIIYNKKINIDAVDKLIKILLSIL